MSPKEDGQNRGYAWNAEQSRLLRLPVAKNAGKHKPDGYGDSEKVDIEEGSAGIAITRYHTAYSAKNITKSTAIPHVRATTEGRRRAVNDFICGLIVMTAVIGVTLVVFYLLNQGF